MIGSQAEKAQSGCTSQTIDYAPLISFFVSKRHRPLQAAIAASCVSRNGAHGERSIATSSWAPLVKNWARNG